MSCGKFCLQTINNKQHGVHNRIFSDSIYAPNGLSVPSYGRRQLNINIVIFNLIPNHIQIVSISYIRYE